MRYVATFVHGGRLETGGSRHAQQSGNLHSAVPVKEDRIGSHSKSPIELVPENNRRKCRLLMMGVVADVVVEAIAVLVLALVA